MLVALYPSKKHCYQNPGNNQVLQILKAGGKLSRGRWFLPADLFRKSTSSETCYFKSDNPPRPKKKKTIVFPAEMGCHEMSHPNLPCNCLELASPKWSPETGLTSLLRGPDWIYLGRWGFILQRLLLEVSTSTSFFHRALWNGRSRKMSWMLEQPEATSLRWVCVSAETLSAGVCCSSKLSRAVENVCK